MEFSVEVGDDSGERESSRLQRRDTPHHLKNKRVNTTTSPPGSSAGQHHQDQPHRGQDQPPHHSDDDPASADSDDRVRRITARQIGRLGESFGSSDQSDAVEVSQGQLSAD